MVRGRPREYDTGVALQRAMDAFWDKGFSGTSLDDLSERMGINRPSLYGAFGDKQALYLKTLESYSAGRHAAVEAALASARPLREQLREVYRRMIDRFVEGDSGARGCYLAGTAVTEAVANPAVRKLLVDSQEDLDRLFRKAFVAAQGRGELAADADADALALFASAVTHTLAMRARAGAPRPRLRKIANSAVALICSSGQAARRSR
jgi:AcrR family transcriptional regulator